MEEITHYYSHPQVTTTWRIFIFSFVKMTSESPVESERNIFLEVDGKIIVIDLDHCRDGKRMENWAADIVSHFRDISGITTAILSWADR